MLERRGVLELSLFSFMRALETDDLFVLKQSSNCLSISILISLLTFLNPLEIVL